MFPGKHAQSINSHMLLTFRARESSLIYYHDYLTNHYHDLEIFSSLIKKCDKTLVLSIKTSAWHQLLKKLLVRALKYKNQISNLKNKKKWVNSKNECKQIKKVNT